jgi:phage baseplate assembly protein V
MDIWARIDSRLKRLIGVAALQLVNDTGILQQAQAQIGVGGPAALQETIDQVPRLGEYGLASCPPAGAQALLVFLGGHRSSGVIVATGDRATRLKDLLAGEAALYNGVKGTFFKLAADGLAHANMGAIFGGQVEASSLKADNGATGTFTAQSGQTITVTNGIITNIS